MPLLPEDVDAKTSFIAERIAAVAGAGGEIVVDEAPISLHETKCNLLGLIRSEHFNWWIDIYRFQLPEIFHLQRMAHGKVEVGNAVVSLEHGRQDSVQIRNSHRPSLFIRAIDGWLFEELTEFFLVE